ncbi:DNA cytosine methyltransferase [Methylobacterium nodulans]|uniref:Cytosine-specific methyltransferase n=1 Tax=Methylobacterium nodulans (strain LMG 21967 / CNCM I-2342 / ORS 2060) TaxID=460265 RepID=B8IIG4_METNO|nr:DNA cytosine methyltransferase [Methylobacterium nodulans]ACL59841.1 DNA-cytosine methyltransferase [Methylobacterium nodulans ORS 2060]
MKPVVVDLFCGCGGLSLGARNAGFKIGLSVDIDAVLTSSYKENHPGAHLRLMDVAALTGSDVRTVVGGRVDGIIGGPPCQGFSEIGVESPDDPRRLLLRHFFRLVAEVRPKFFLMENVRGLAFEKNRPELETALQLVAGRYTILGPLKLDAAAFGAATSRPRVFVIGFDSSCVDSFTAGDLEQWRRPAATVREAIADLQGATEEGVDSDGLDWWRYGSDISPSLYARRLRGTRRLFSGHRRIPHAPAIAERFAAVPQGGRDAVGRHARLDWNKQCPTIRAGTGPDRGSFQAVRPLHPVEPRVITVREAARLQGFPDRFVFHPTAWHSFRMIGNSVSPIVAERILKAIRSKMFDVPSLAAAE